MARHLGAHQLGRFRSHQPYGTSVNAGSPTPGFHDCSLTPPEFAQRIDPSSPVADLGSVV